MLAMILVAQFLLAPKAQALQLTIPEIEARVSDEFLVESIAKLDDFIENIRAKERIRDVENVGFAVSSLVQLGVVTGILLDQFIFGKKLVTGVVDEVKKLSTTGQVGRLQLDIGSIIKRWMVGTGAVNIAASRKPKEFTVHVQDLALFREILTSVRNKQAAILYRFWRDKSAESKIFRAKFLDLENIIREQRPSFKEIYESCSADPETYKIEMTIEIYSKSLKDYFTALMLTPNAVTRQVEAGFISPSLRWYINQDVLPMALKKCFKISAIAPAENRSEFRQFVLGVPVLGAGVAMATDIGNNEHHRFIAQLFTADMTAKFVTVAAIYLIFRIKNIFRNATMSSASTTGKFKDTWMGDIMRYIKLVFSKISPRLIAKSVVMTQLAISGYSLFVIKKEYDLSKEDGFVRRSSEESNRLAKKYFQDKAAEQITELQNLLGEKDLGVKDRAAIEKEIRNWKILETEMAS